MKHEVDAEFQKITEGFGIDKAHLGIIVLANLEIGYLTPPIGMNLFISSLKFDRSIISLYRSVLLFIGLLLFALIIITYVPALSLWLPRVLGKMSTPLLLEYETLYYRVSLSKSGVARGTKLEFAIISFSGCAWELGLLAINRVRLNITSAPTRVHGFQAALAGNMLVRRRGVSI